MGIIYKASKAVIYGKKINSYQRGIHSNVFSALTCKLCHVLTRLTHTNTEKKNSKLRINMSGELGSVNVKVNANTMIEIKF